jgi:RND family efflux transporter MFP subunit
MPDSPAAAFRALASVIVALALVVAPACEREQPAFAPPPPPEVTVATPVERTVEDALYFTGTTRGVESVEVRARVRGFLQEKLVENGRTVQQGDLLFVIDPRTFQAAVRQAQAAISAREADLRLTEVTVQRVTQAVASNAASQQELDRAQAERDAAQAQLEQAQAALQAAELDLEFTQVRAPISGRVGFVNVDQGQLVGANEATLLATIVNDSRIYATYEVDERTLLRLRRQFENRRPGEGGRPLYPVYLGLSDGTDYPFRGEFFTGDSRVDPSTGTIRVEAVYDNANGALLPGLFVRLRTVLGERDSLLVPDLAVLSDPRGRFVLVVNDKNTVERRAVEVGEVFDGMREIVGGLGTNERVVVNGLQRARPGAEVVPVTQAPAPATPTAPAPSNAGG